MNHSRLIDDARAATGLEDFGADGWREGLERYVSALDAEADLTELGALATEAQIVANLSNRLRVTAWWAEHPELAAQRIERPMIVLGLPRTGTTLVSELLAPRPREPVPAALGGRELGAATPRGRAGDRPARRGGARQCRRHGRAQPRLQGDPLRGARWPHRVRRRARAGFQEPALVGDHPRAVVRRVAARLRRDLSVRVPPPGARAAAVGGAGAVGVEDATSTASASTRSSRSIPTRASS